MSTCAFVTRWSWSHLTSSLAAVQGTRGGEIISITGIIIADLVPLRERAPFIALLGLCADSALTAHSMQLTFYISQGLGYDMCNRPIGGRCASEGRSVATVILCV